MGHTERFSGLDERSCRQLVHYARSLVGSYGFTGSDIEDIQQELYLRLYQQLPKYDPRRGSKATFVDRVLRNSVCDLTRRQKSECRNFAMCTLSLDQPVFSDGESAVMPIETMGSSRHLFGTSACSKNNMDKVDLQIDVRRVVAGIEPEMQQFCLDLASEKSATQIAREHGICRQTFYTWKERVHAIFESAGLQAYVGDSTCGG